MRKESEQETKKGATTSKTNDKSRSGRRGSRKKKGNRSMPVEDYGNRHSNDPRWYGSETQLVRDTANINFTQVCGLPLNRRSVSTETGASIDIAGEPSDRVPGICTIFTSPTFGVSKSRDSALNLGATAAYSFVRHANSGSKNYDATDFGIGMLAHASMLSFIKFLKRVYGCVSLYSINNRYVPRALVEAQLVDFDDLVGNLANFRFQLDNLINKASCVAVPATMSIFARQAFMYEDVFIEGMSSKDQLYMYVPYNFLKFTTNTVVDEASPSYGSGMLEVVPYATAGTRSEITTYKRYKVAELFAMGNEMLDAILSQEDFGIMTGDIIKAFGGNGIIRQEPMPLSYVQMPRYSADVLWQMKNATLVNNRNDDGGKFVPARMMQVITSDPLHLDGYLVTAPSISINGDWDIGGTPESWEATFEYLSGDTIITSDKESPTPEEVLESTRLKAYLVRNDDMFTYGGLITIDDALSGYPLYCGSEVAVQAIYWALDSTGSLQPFNVGSVWRGYAPYTQINATSYHQLATTLGVLSNFKFHPELMVRTDTGWVSIFDIDNYSVQSNPVIGRIHEAALFNMLATPTIAGLLAASRG